MGNGIVLSEPMFRAVIKGRKTQIRIPIMSKDVDTFMNKFDECGYVELLSYTGHYEKLQPRFKAGDVMYLKEPFAFDFDNKYIEKENQHFCNGNILYKYDYFLFNDSYRPIIFEEWIEPCFMPERYARYLTQIENVRCENVCDISDSDCFSEGVLSCVNNILNYEVEIDNGIFLYGESPQIAFAKYFNSIFWEKAFEQMQWVWVYTFKCI